MRAVRQFNVVPAIPEPLAALDGLARNLHWTWDTELQSLFRELDHELWEWTAHDPMRMLAAITAERWQELAADGRIIEATHTADERLHEATTDPRWFQSRTGSPLELVAYFSPEFGISETLPQYSGGLGVLAGDHLKACSDLGVPLVAIGLLYAEGYFRQLLNADGLQEERFPRLDTHGLAITPTGKEIEIDLAGDIVRVTSWKVQVGRIELYLLDTAVDGNSPDGYSITDRLYGGDTEHRLRQEIVLGIGGVRMLRALGLNPQVFHTNEGHAGFLSLERIRELHDEGLSFPEAIEVVRAGGIFTTHTPVPAGIDRFEPALLERYFGAALQAVGLSMKVFMTLGWRPDEPEETKFNMAVMGLRLAGRSNGVAKLHGAVSREMFAGLWPDVPVEEVPIGSITNGVHAHTWVGEEMDRVLRRGVGSMWDGADRASWAGIDNVDDADVWAARHRNRAALVSFVHDCLGESLLDPTVLTIGFARRFATYKRATLLFGQADRLRRLLLDADRPVQFVFAGKAHPADLPGKEMIQQIEVFARQLDVGHRFVFIPDYDMAVARVMYHGCDVWLNNPRRPLEACGTSGMKAALNGALNCSILDGWWDECYDGHNGWAIQSADDDPDTARRDQREATSLFGILERDMIPLFYDRGDDGIPHRWIAKMKHNWKTLGPYVTAARMVRDYTTDLYEPAARSSVRASADGYAAAKDLAAWKLRVLSTWGNVRIVDLDIDSGPAREGDVREVRGKLVIDGLQVGDMSVEALHGPIDSTASFVGPPAHVSLDIADDGTFSGRINVSEAGPYGVTVRALPIHADLTSPVELGLMSWAD